MRLRQDGFPCRLGTSGFKSLHIGPWGPFPCPAPSLLQALTPHSQHMGRFLGPLTPTPPPSVPPSLAPSCSGICVAESRTQMPSVGGEQREGKVCGTWISGVR